MIKYLVESTTHSIYNNETNEQIEQDEPFTIVELNEVETEYDKELDYFEVIDRIENLEDKILNEPSFEYERVDFEDQIEYEIFDTLKEAQKFYNSIQ